MGNNHQVAEESPTSGDNVSNILQESSWDQGTAERMERGQPAPCVSDSGVTKQQMQYEMSPAKTFPSKIRTEDKSIKLDANKTEQISIVVPPLQDQSSILNR